jgi:proline iminopeptidase
MEARKLYVALFLLIPAVCGVTCAPLDVRLGTGSGDGVKLSYRIVGEDNPLIVIHDGPGYEKSLMYGGFDALASDMKVIYYDQRGCGRSQPLTPMISSTIADNVEDLEALRRYFHIKKFSIAAHGWGSAIALNYARKYHDRVESIVLITPMSPFAHEPKDRTVFDRLPGETRLKIDDLLNHPNMSILERQERIMRLTVPALFYRQEAAKKINTRDLRLAPDVTIRMGDELASLDLFSLLNEISAPTLVVIGRHDIITPVMDQMAYADGISTSTVVVFNGSGHFPFLEEGDFFLTVVREFLLHGRIPALVSAGGVG